jgi:hypothetical protein
MRQCQVIFFLWFFLQTIPTRPLIHTLKYFRILLRIRRNIIKYVLYVMIPCYAAFTIGYPVEFATQFENILGCSLGAYGGNRFTKIIDGRDTVSLRSLYDLVAL